MPPSTGSDTSPGLLRATQDMRLPTELIENIISDLVGEQLHNLFTGISSTSPGWNAIQTFLRTSLTFRSVTSQILIKLFHEDAPIETSCTMNEQCQDEPLFVLLLYTHQKS